MVSFEGESLGTAVAEINRHNRRQIVIDDPSLASVPVVGVFRTTDIEGFQPPRPLRSIPARRLTATSSD